MKRFSKKFLFLGFLLFFGAMPGRSAIATPDTTLTDTIDVPPSRPLRERIDNIVASDPLLLRSQMAMLVYDLDADTVVYDYGSLQLMRPASVIKLLTATTALHNLGADYLFRTRLLARGFVRDSVFYGDLFIKGGFDPLFTHDDMYSFVQSIRRRGIRAIRGHIFADLSFKDTLKWGRGWCWDDKEQTLTPLLYDARDTFMPRFFRTLDIDSVSHPANYSRATLLAAQQQSESLVATPANKQSIIDTITANPQANAASLDFSAFPIEQWDVRTHSISQMLPRMLKASDNLYAEALFYQLGAADTMPFASALASAQKEYDLLLELGLNPGDYSIADGSGLSIYNLLTPQLVVRLLRYVWQTPDISGTLIPCLPVMGEDGTLRRRLKNTPAQENIIAKTGTLSHVASLAGYATTPTGTHLAFCIFNQGVRTSQEGRDFQNRICLQMVK